ncbi:hypothetical protein [Brevibacterium luteolum]|uniref:hypothetical protein n=1 Tax=Brevibacterium luteolum TaxID=199591 RepID=UPI00223B9DE9|nr:hypothetical protein [Brevibacterium luteolum]MCT1874203.1 hypothetical protein [Brevibacterium luteolum]MCT1891501.1 hypothetical protein [Brevibacterium luteolum]MCT1893950.1 hypothetical protein [Brevibacterium luteolum]MCT1924843.1 hypothetical protein [Brevibacterium luteolum]
MNRTAGLPTLTLGAACLLAASLSVWIEVLFASLLLAATLALTAAGLTFILLGVFARYSSRAVRAAFLIGCSLAAGLFAFGTLRLLLDNLAHSGGANIGAGLMYLAGSLLTALAGLIVLTVAVVGAIEAQRAARTPAAATPPAAATDPGTPTAAPAPVTADPTAGRTGDDLPRIRRIIGFACLLSAAPLFMAVSTCTDAPAMDSAWPTACLILFSCCAVILAISGVWLLAHPRIMLAACLLIYLLGLGLLFARLPRFASDGELDHDARLSVIELLTIGAPDLLAAITAGLALAIAVRLTVRSTPTPR